MLFKQDENFLVANRIAKLWEKPHLTTEEKIYKTVKLINVFYNQLDDDAKKRVIGFLQQRKAELESQMIARESVQQEGQSLN